MGQGKLWVSGVQAATKGLQLYLEIAFRLTGHSHPAAEIVGASRVPHILGGRCVV